MTTDDLLVQLEVKWLTVWEAFSGNKTALPSYRFGENTFYFRHFVVYSRPVGLSPEKHTHTCTQTHTNHDSRKDSPSFDLDKVLLKPT